MKEETNDSTKPFIGKEVSSKWSYILTNSSIEREIYRQRPVRPKQVVWGNPSKKKRCLSEMRQKYEWIDL